MAYIGSAYRIYYTAKNYAEGLGDVYYYVYKPSGAKLGPYLMTELNNDTAKGIYYDDFLDADIEGNYIFIASSVSVPKQHEKSVLFERRIFSSADRDQIITTLQFLSDIEGGKWEISENQMIFYKSDNITEVARFNLFDKSGVPAGDNVYKRERT